MRKTTGLISKETSLCLDHSVARRVGTLGVAPVVAGGRQLAAQAGMGSQVGLLMGWHPLLGVEHFGSEPH